MDTERITRLDIYPHTSILYIELMMMPRISDHTPRSMAN